MAASDDGGEHARRRGVVRNAVGVGVATGAYGLSFGALSVAAGLSFLQTTALSLLLFSGASQFALIATVAGGGSPLLGAATATLLGTRNAFYGLRLAELLRLRPGRRIAAAQFVIDESTAMALAAEEQGDGPLGFWATGVSIYVLWNLATALGAAAGATFSDPKVFGLDAAVPAAFIALLASRLVGRRTRIVAVLAAVVAVATTPVLPEGVPVLLAAGIAVAVGLALPVDGESAP